MGDRNRIVAWIAEWLEDGRRLLLMSDFDGTLSPFAADPARASLGGDARGHLRSLADDRRIRLAIISGRDLADLRARVGVPEAIYAGCHGLEIGGPDVAFSHPDAEAQQDALRSIRRTLQQRAAAFAGVRIESKRLGLAVHYRDVAPDQVRQVEAELARAIERCGSGLAVFRGIRALEVVPRVGWAKGECARYIRQRIEPAAERPLMTVYLGDDSTDEPAFDALSGQAVTIRVGTDIAPSKAEYRLDDVHAVESVLAELASVIRGARA
jgi:trehalose-phosphatase